ncbi:MAG: sigma-70 family RNA polymerase sigma factor [Planctomycetota bacterium]
MDFSDQELVRTYLAGNSSSFDELVKRYSKLVGTIAFGVVRDVEAAKDITQEVFVKAYRSLASLSNPEKFKSWIYGITRTTSIDWLRAQKKNKVSLDELEEKGIALGNASISAGPTPLQHLEEEESKSRIRQEILTLPEKYKEIILLKHIQNYSYKEICELLGITQSAVETRLFRARLLLKNKLKQMVEEMQSSKTN